MKVYEVEITETLTQIVTIRANNLDEAYGRVKEKYDKSEIILNADDFQSVEINVNEK